GWAAEKPVARSSRVQIQNKSADAASFSSHLGASLETSVPRLVATICSGSTSPGFLKYMTTMPKTEPIADGMIACALMPNEVPNRRFAPARRLNEIGRAHVRKSANPIG